MTLDNILEEIKKAQTIVILTHESPDGDAIGSALGIKAICDSFNKSSAIVYDPKYAEKKVRTAMASLFTNDQLTKMIVSIKEMYRNKKIKPNLIIVFTKADFGKMKTFFSDKKINQIKKNQKINENQKAFDLLAEQFFHEFSEINTLNILKN